MRKKTVFLISVVIYLSIITLSHIFYLFVFTKQDKARCIEELQAFNDGNDLLGIKSMVFLPQKSEVGFRYGNNYDVKETVLSFFVITSDRKEILNFHWSKTKKKNVMLFIGLSRQIGFLGRGKIYPDINSVFASSTIPSYYFNAAFSFLGFIICITIWWCFKKGIRFIKWIFFFTRHETFYDICKWLVLFEALFCGFETMCWLVTPLSSILSYLS